MINLRQNTMMLETILENLAGSFVKAGVFTLYSVPVIAAVGIAYKRKDLAELLLLVPSKLKLK